VEKKKLDGGEEMPVAVMPEDVRRTLRVFAPGTRVVAACAILYAAPPLEVEEGKRGTVIGGVERVSGMSAVHWDGVSGAWATINSAIDEVGS
jgi:hypothetical protein